MKRVLVLNGDSYVGRHVVKAFYESQEYDVEITRTKSDARKIIRGHAAATGEAHNLMCADAPTHEAHSAPPLSDHAPNLPQTQSIMRSNNSVSSSSATAAATLLRQQQWEAEERAALPADIRPCVCGVVPKHNNDTEAFRTRLLANDVVVAVLEDDAYEATCAIRILESTHYEVEKTFVLVSSAVTWAYTLVSERARARLTQQLERAEARDNFFEELLEAEEEDREDNDDESAAAVAARDARRAARRRELEPRLPPSLRDPLPGEDEDEILELVPDRVFTDDGYAARVPHPRFQHWHALEHLVKRANTQTLHTYVVFAGVPYGDGEGEAVLFGLLRSAWYHQTLLQYGPGTNAIPMIHVLDLAAILFKLGNSYDTLDERYMFAVDQGKVTQRQLLQAVQAKLGGSVQPARSSQHALRDVAVPITTATTLAAVGGASAPASGSPTAVNGYRASHSSAKSRGPSSSAHPRPATTAYTFSGNLVHLDRLELPLPSSPEELFQIFGNEPCWSGSGPLLSTLALSDIQAEPATVLNLHPAEEWVALEGFTMNLDLVVAQFREAHEHMFRPVRTLITGPPLSGAEALAVSVAERYHTPVLNASTIVRDYKAHVADVREALRSLLVRRLQRRRARVQARLVRRAAQEKAARLAALAAERRAKRDARRQYDRGEDEESGDAESDANDSEDGHDDPAAAEETSDEDEEDFSKQDSPGSSISIFIPPKASLKAADADDGGDGEDEDEGEDDAVSPRNDDYPLSHDRPQHALLRPAEEVVNEAYLCGGGNAAAAGDDYNDDAGSGDAGIIDEEQEEEEGMDEGGEPRSGTWLEQLEEEDAEKQAELLEGQELLPEEASDSAEGGQQFVMPRFAARRRGRAFARDVDRQERRCIAVLRREYLLGLKVLSLKVSASDGRLPRPPQPPMSDEEDDANNGDVDAMANRRGYGRQQGQEDEDEEGEDGSQGSLHQDSDGAAESGDDASGEGDARDAEGKDNEDSDDDSSSASAGDDELEAAGEEDVANYLDCALAFMCRWRLRQADCRCQGYVLGNFPQTLSQAVLCFKATEAELEDPELRRRRALAPLLTRLDDHESNNNGADAEAGGDAEDDDGVPLPPPLDEDFPLPEIANMEEAELRALERAHWRARGGVSDAGPTHLNATSESAEGDVEDPTEASPEEVMAPVDEALFVEHVVSLQADATLLRATVETLETNLKAAAGVASSIPSDAQRQQNAQGDEMKALDALRSLLSASPYASQLEDYLHHHAPTAPPTQSLLAWLRTVTTTPTLGARPPPVIVPLSGGAAGADGFSNADTAAGDAAGADEGGITTTTLEAPSTTRTAEVVAVPAPVLSVAQVKASWGIAYDASHRPSGGNSDSAAASPREREGEGAVLLREALPMALLRLAPLLWTDGATAAPASPLPTHRAGGQPRRRVAEALKALPLHLTELECMLCTHLVPLRRLAARAPSTVVGAADDTSSIAATPFLATPTMPPLHATHSNSSLDSLNTIARERMQLVDLEMREQQLVEIIAREDAAQLFQERVALRKLQLAEESRDAAVLLQMPAATYLMKYVLPSLTPAMTEVVRTRSDDPVRALADVLFDYHRRTTV
ncbi:hypothetical protein ABL78_4394 [Leptomonas seymouri]|uniref:Uncharacterized protein n=1 Tax=Leptomonas seymouri TaxID=5684 RepID=A0A0N0P5J1_LEPSE|nr:hypothetical protein ABL78_4394 [Leptomonas seymouri]|eukprot:KPI86529.1 hypothetical protein ABL78_4394 [Leptomonas seymouri]